VKFLTTIIIAASLFTVTYANATLITQSIVSTEGRFHNNTNSINDGILPDEYTRWTKPTNVWWRGLNKKITLDFGGLYNINNVLLSLDNNDSYKITWSNDQQLWSTLFSIKPSDGEVTARRGGMDTMSTDITHNEYIAALDFSSVQARYIRIQATGGDNSYSIGEFQAFGSKVGSIPEPTSLAIFALGIAGLASRRFAIKS
jgi:hypothetical protein